MAYKEAQVVSNAWWPGVFSVSVGRHYVTYGFDLVINEFIRALVLSLKISASRPLLVWSQQPSPTQSYDNAHRTRNADWP